MRAATIILVIALVASSFADDPPAAEPAAAAPAAATPEGATAAAPAVAAPVVAAPAVAAPVAEPETAASEPGAAPALSAGTMDQLNKTVTDAIKSALSDHLPKSPLEQSHREKVLEQVGRIPIIGPMITAAVSK